MVPVSVYPAGLEYPCRTLPSTTLIASHCWTYYSKQLTSLIGTGQQEYKDQLTALVLVDLAAVHNVDVNYLTSRYIEKFSWD